MHRCKISVDRQRTFNSLSPSLSPSLSLSLSLSFTIPLCVSLCLFLCHVMQQETLQLIASTPIHCLREQEGEREGERMREEKN